MQGDRWTELHHMLADLIDAVAHNTTATYRVNAGKKRIGNPRRYPRPGQKDGTRMGQVRPVDQAKAVAYLDSLKPPRGA